MFVGTWRCMLNASEMSIIPPKPKEPKVVGTSVRLPEEMVTRLDEIALETERSRNEVVVYLLQWAMQQYAAEKKQPK